ncbi:MAG: sulfurtransferase TusA family protein [Terriglobales bacterium]
MFYEIPASLPGELDELESLVERYRKGELDATSLKARRVPFGCYEQRKDGTYMVRIRCTGGTVTPRQLRTIAELAALHGSKTIHITTRQEFQIHDLRIEDVVPVMRQLLSVGLSTRGGGGNTVRNIMVSPEAGIAVEEVFDPTPYALALTSRVIAEPDSWVLPRKFKIAFSNSDKDTAFAQFNDLGFIAKVQNGEKGFKVYIAGGMGAKPEVGHLVREFVPAGDVHVVTVAAKRLFDKYGNRKNKHAARLRFLWNSLGEERFLKLYGEELEQARKSTATLEVPTSATQMWGTQSTEVFDPTSAAQKWGASAEFEQWKRRYVSPQRQAGLYSILIPAFLGNLSTQAVLRLAEFLEPLGDDVVRASMGQNLRLRNIPEAYLGNVYELVKDISEVFSFSSAPRLLANSIACTGADTCQLGICLSKGALRAVARKLTKFGLDLDQIPDFQLNLSGCPNTCGQHMIADLGFYGNVGRNGQDMFPAYAVVAGAVIGGGEARLARTLDRVSARDLPDFVCDVLRTYLPKKHRFATFAAYVDAEGADDIRAICDRYRDVPAFEDDKNYYFDWGSQEVFSLVGKGVGECSAGLFDLIEVDLKNIRRLREQLTAGANGETDSLLYHLALSAARALLITRGIEAKSDAAVFSEFSTHFIKAGLVDAQFQPVVEAARTGDATGLRARQEELFALGEAIEKLYASMDNSLRFPAELTAQPAAQPGAAGPHGSPHGPKVHVERDYRAVGCPMNFVKVKLDLARMQKGERLKVLLGDGAPIENVPRSVAAEGHRVLEQVRVGEHWSVVIQKEAGA